MGTLRELITKAKDAKEPQVQPEGQYKLRIAMMEQKFGKASGKPYLFVLFSFEQPEKVPAAPLRHMFMYHDPDQTEDMNARRELEIKQFIEAFEINADSLADEKFDEQIGKTGFALVTERDEGEYGIQNHISRFVKS